MILSDGGPVFTYTILLLCIAVIVLFVKAILEKDYGKKSRSILASVGWLALAWGYLGRTFGLIMAFDKVAAAGEILGFFPDDIYYDELATNIAASFNEEFKDPADQFSPQMGILPEESGLSDYIAMTGSMSVIIITIFVVAMSIVLWNAGLMGSLRRYGEIGVRLAVGEDKGHIYKTLLLESVMVGIAGSVLGTLAGAGVAYLMQVYGLDFGFLLKNSSMMMSNIYRAQLTPGSFFIGFAPGIISTVLGAAIAGHGIYKRQTSQLFKELEV